MACGRCGQQGHNVRTCTAGAGSNGGARGGGGGGFAPTVRLCSNCRSPGHDIRSCTAPGGNRYTAPISMQLPAPTVRLCSNCRSSGHDIRTCTAPGGNRYTAPISMQEAPRPSYSTNSSYSQNLSTSSTSISERRCSNCREPGHNISTCIAPGGKKFTGGFSSSSSSLHASNEIPSITSSSISGSERRCSNCRQQGHNISTCTAPGGKQFTGGFSSSSSSLHASYEISSISGSERRCSNCRQQGHNISSCTAPGGKQFSGESDISTGSQCILCKGNHSRLNCPTLKKSTPSSSSTTPIDFASLSGESNINDLRAFVDQNNLGVKGSSKEVLYQKICNALFDREDASSHLTSCNLCGKSTHKDLDCPLAAPSPPRTTKTPSCETCGKKSHETLNCPLLLNSSSSPIDFASLSGESNINDLRAFVDQNNLGVKGSSKEVLYQKICNALFDREDASSHLLTSCNLCGKSTHKDLDCPLVADHYSPPINKSSITEPCDVCGSNDHQTHICPFADFSSDGVDPVITTSNTGEAWKPRDDAIKVKGPKNATITSQRVSNVVFMKKEYGGSASGFHVVWNNIHCIMTNHHVLESEVEALTWTAYFDYELGRTNLIAIKLDPSRFFANNYELDFAICAVADARQVAKREAIPLRRNAYDEDVDIIIIQHPHGEPKTESKGKIVRENDKFFFHTANTLPGSSGSPIFNSKYTLIGIHHSAHSTKGSYRDVAGLGGGTAVVDIVDYLRRKEDYGDGRDGA